MTKTVCSPPMTPAGFAAVFFAALFSIASSDRAAADMFGSGANTFHVELITIGFPGNAGDATGAPNPAGAVPYSYRMGKLEISEQIIDKANVLGGLSITKDSRGSDKPATSTSWNEAARFVNWLNASTGYPLAYKFAIQPGQVGYDANANIELWTSGDAGYDANNLYRNSMARYFLPSVNEWYKAAYHDPMGGVYYDFPTGSNSPPTSVASGTAPGTAVYGQFLIDAGPADISLAGGPSPWGTVGQGGNAWEWEETDVDLANGGSVANRGIRGGDWDDFSSSMLASTRYGIAASFEDSNFGFRVASTLTGPEPSSVTLFGIGSLAVLRRRRRFVLTPTRRM